MPTYPVINLETKEKKTLNMTMKQYAEIGKMKTQDGTRIGLKDVQVNRESLSGQEKRSRVVGTKFWTVHLNNQVPRFGNIVTTPSNSYTPRLCPQKERRINQ